MTEQPRTLWQRFMLDHFRTQPRLDSSGYPEQLKREVEPPVETAPYRTTFSGETTPDDADLVRRIARSFRAACAMHTDPAGSFWKSIVEQKKGDVSAALMNDDIDLATKLLRDPSSTMFHYGFDNLVSDFRDALKNGGDAAQKQQGAVFHVRLVYLAEVIGAIRLANPESRSRAALDTDILIDGIEAIMGGELSFPNPFPNEFGIASKRGVASYRAINSLYQAILLKRYAAEMPSPSVLDIGGGLGRTAYYAQRFGFENYTLIDLPTTGVAQAYFLGRTLGDDQISLQGEERAAVNMRIPEWLPEAPPVDIVINVDSFTEMSRGSAETYIQWAKENAKLLISINHEANPFTVRELMLAAGLSPSRERYWLRDGYVVEVAEL
jgi:hypothetical protein